jgi:hypothetical protein
MSDWTTPEDDFMGGTSYPAVSFTNIGDAVIGIVDKVTRKPDTQPDGTPKTWSNGDPMHVFIMDLRDPKTGEMSTLWVRGNMVKAIRDAVRKAGYPGPVGKLIRVEHTGVGAPTQKGFRGANLFACQIKDAPADAAPAKPPVAAVSAWDEEESAPF